MWAEAVGFEPTGRSSRPHVFKTCAIVHSATPPNRFLRVALNHSATLLPYFRFYTGIRTQGPPKDFSFEKWTPIES